jgi:repressor LexA
MPEAVMAQLPSETERRILDYMVSYLKRNTYQPSIREIGEEFGIKSTKTVSEHLQALAEKGFLERDPSRSRGVRILGVDLNPEAVSIPLLSRLPDDGEAGVGTDDYLTVDRRLAGSEGCFFVRARGDEMALMGGQDGDYLLIEPVRLREVPDDGVVAARPGGGAAGYYRIRRVETGVRLQGLSGGTPLHLEDPATLPVLGRVIAFHRRMDGTVAAPALSTAH